MLWNPYSLEEQHSEDRPYAYSGPLFTEGTPWGAILNPTIGEILKPEKELHPWRLQNGVDIYALLGEINKSIKQAAKDYTSTNYISIRGNDVTSQWFNAWNAPLSGSSVLTMFSNGNGINYVPGATYGVYPGDSGVFGTPNIYGFPEVAPGLRPAGGYRQSLTGGFNAFSRDARERLYELTQNGQDVSVRRLFDQWLWGDSNRLLLHGDVVQDQEGNLGVYKDHRERRPKGAKLTTKDWLKKEQVVDSENSFYTKQGFIDIINAYNAEGEINFLNERTKQLAREKVDSPWQIDEDEGFLSGRSLMNYRPSQAMDLLNDTDAVTDLLNSASGSDFIREATTSGRLVGGIYGYMGSEALGIGVYNEKRIQRSDAMTSWNRTFWDYNMGGFGGPVSEIVRRFIPPYSSSKFISPLRNTMPEWLPQQFQMGSPYEKIPEGEARLPGKGWEALNEYHPDMYSTEDDRTGAFDRYKILADIAPGSAEYKLWREIARKTVTDPELIAEMDEIRDRANRQSKKHDFYPYQIVGHGVEYQEVIVSEILGYGKFRSGNQIYKMAGISVNANEDESQADVLSRYMHVGQKVVIAVDENPAYAINKDAQKSANATVFVNGENINRAMLENEDAKKRKGDTSSAATLANMTSTQVALGYVSEVVGHLDIPILSDQWLRIRSPIESYRAEYIYGTPYQSWSHPIDTFVQPAFERAIHEQPMGASLFWYAFTNANRWREHTPEFTVDGQHVSSMHIGRGPRGLLTAAALLTNRGALIGAGIGLILKQDASFAMKMARRTQNAVNVARFFSGGSSIEGEMFTGAAIGSWVSGTFLEKGYGKGAFVGAALGAAYRVLSGKAGETWVPDRVKKNWELTDYFDRLEYMKYMGLYHEAAKRAKEEEGVDVEELLENVEEAEEDRQKKLSGLKKLKKELSEAYGGKTSPLKNELLKMVNQRTNDLAAETKVVQGGEYTNAAVLYKQAADRTMYGLREGAGWSETMSALPQTDREYFIEFVKETDPRKRAEILATVSPFLGRALRMQWHMPLEDRPDNEEFFDNHYLPDSDWEGWNPDVNLKDIEVKTIENEAMNLSDFGFYESQLRTPGAVTADALDFQRPDEAQNVKRRIQRVLQGQGLTDIEVSVTANSTMSYSQIKAAFKTFAGMDDQQRRVDDSVSNGISAA